ncbi:MAG: ribulose-phosphate 3-epimerase [bacterium]
MEIRPSILAANREEFARKVELVRSLGLALHVDVMDGVFVGQSCWAEPLTVNELADGLRFDAHLMVSQPEHEVPVWLVSDAERVFFHVESTHRQELILRTVNDRPRIGLALNPNTPVSDVAPFFDRISSVLVMTVEPGRSGQPMLPDMLRKVRTIRGMSPNLHITVDGGVRPDNIAAVADAGADAVVVGSALTDAPDPTAALRALMAAIQLTVTT